MTEFESKSLDYKKLIALKPGDAVPIMDGFGAEAGVSDSVSREDHIHPTNTSNFSATNPVVDGTASPGVATTFARSDHKHPSDTTKANLATPTFTGVPLSTTPAVDDTTTKIATTAFVIGQAGASAPLVEGTATVGTSKKYSREDHKHPLYVRPNVRAFNNANVAVANNTETAIALNSESFDSDTMHDNATLNTRLTCKTAGVYLIIAQANFTNVNAVGIRQLGIKLNNSSYIGRSVPAIGVGATEVRLNISTLYTLAVNDYVEMIAFQTSGVSENITYEANDTPVFSMVRVA